MASSQHSSASSQSPTPNLVCERCDFEAASVGGLKTRRKGQKCRTREALKLNKAVSSAASSAAVVQDLGAKLQLMRRNISVLDRIPRSARIAAAIAFKDVIENCLGKNDTASWNPLFTFSFVCLRVPDTARRKESLTTLVKRNLLSTDLSIPEQPERRKKGESDDYLRRQVDKKIQGGNVSVAVRLLSSEDTIAPHSIETLTVLQEKHPSANKDHDLDRFEPLNDAGHTEISVDEIRTAIASFPNDSSGGIDSLRPQHLKDMIETNSESSDELCSTLTKLVDRIIHKPLPEEIRPLFFGAAFTALRKKDGGIRPIAVGNTL